MSDCPLWFPTSVFVLAVDDDGGGGKLMQGFRHKSTGEFKYRPVGIVRKNDISLMSAEERDRS